MQENTVVVIFKGRFGLPPDFVSVDGTAIPIRYTSGVMAAVLTRKGVLKFVEDSIVRHARGDWGEVCQEDSDLNDNYPDSAMSTYVFEEDLKIWIKSENGMFIVLLPEEY